MKVAAFLDASVLYPSVTRSILMHLAAFGTYQPLWSDAVHDEWVAALLRNRPDLSPTRIARTRALMDAHVNNATVAGFEPLIATLTLPDPNDRHVLAAARHGGASVIVTANLKDFPATALAPYNITAEHPHSFISGLIEAETQSAVAAFAADRAAMAKTVMTVAEYLTALEAHDLRHTALELRTFASEI